jgi:hypothetical protein
VEQFGVATVFLCRQFDGITCYLVAADGISAIDFASVQLWCRWNGLMLAVH